MVTAAQVKEAHRACQRQRLMLAKSLELDDAAATPDDLAIGRRVLTAARGDGDSYDRALADRRVNDLFLRGILRFSTKGNA